MNRNYNNGLSLSSRRCRSGSLPRRKSVTRFLLLMTQNRTATALHVCYDFYQNREYCRPDRVPRGEAKTATQETLFYYEMWYRYVGYSKSCSSFTLLPCVKKPWQYIRFQSTLKQPFASVVWVQYCLYIS